MRKIKYILVLFLISFKGFSQQTGLNDNGNKISLNYLSLQGGTLTGTLSATAGIQNVGTFTNTGNIVSSGTIATSSNIVAGSATTTNSSAVLEANSSTQGFLPPRVALTATNAFSPLTGTAASATGLFVYNTATAGTAPNNVVPGYYYWNGSSWINFIASNTSTSLPNDQTGTSYTLTSADNGKVIILNNASPITLNVPYFFVGFNCMVVQKGTGQVTLAINGTTTNIYNRYNFTKTAGQYAILTLVCSEANKYISSGDMSN